MLDRVRLKLRIYRRRVANAGRLVGWDRASGPRTTPGTAVNWDAPGSDGPARVPVVLCTWRRPEQLRRTIALLQAQTHPAVELHVWNNSRRISKRIDTIASEAADLPVRVTHSARNVGGFGRFYLARELAGDHPFVVFIDDDQTFSETFIADLLADKQPRGIAGFWAYHFLSETEYADRNPAEPGERVKYCGTGGMISDSGIFSEPRLFECPGRFWFAEDLWLSYVADHLLDWEIRKSRVTMAMDEDGLDQFLLLHTTKSSLLQYLVGEGWDVLASPPEPAYSTRG
jgi:hypothetical protein